MRIAIVNKSDSTGGAAVVSHRLLDALRHAGHDARMLVAEKLTDSPYVETIADEFKIRSRFIADRLPVALANRFNRGTLFKMDGGFAGLPLIGNPVIQRSDIVILNWINQGVASLKGVKDLLKSGKKIIWTMHDMWNMTGICHHAGDCRHYLSPTHCGSCPLLGRQASSRDISFQISKKKEALYNSGEIHFVAVSQWLADKASESTLLSRRDVSVIPNPFPLPAKKDILRIHDGSRIRLIFIAARLDDDIKDFPTLILTLSTLISRHPELKDLLSITLIGDIRDRSLIRRIPVHCNYRGIIKDPSEIKRAIESSDIVVSSSSYETLPGTLIEGQAYGAVPVAFLRGGQRDIIDDGITGTLAEWNDDMEARAVNLAKAIYKAIPLCTDETRLRMYDSVRRRFSPESIAESYLNI